ncbi:hypothetical protein [Pyxidicoccus sp. MSG2]|uniref:hypothetical protein n=1 Tax=Pyxidicoccus sp. MSG2 TaxID=2996790 RepID=UPI00226E8ECD|nr:hypothetical protein [Pyxidicoccus sp. MSG2]MCY1014429.1 hypothetical protein [Pyxidicoccus sp. MSG2]
MAQSVLKLPNAAPQQVENPLSLRDALRQASQDPMFARRLIEAPESLKAQYGLSDETIEEIKRVTQAPLAEFTAQVEKVGSSLEVKAMNLEKVDDGGGYE